VLKSVPISERLGKVQLRFEIFNLFNHANFGNPSAVVTAVTVGRITTAGPGRITAPGARAAPAYQAARCLLWMVERRGCLAARGGLVRLPAAIARCVPGDAATMHPVPGDSPLTRGGQRRDRCL